MWNKITVFLWMLLLNVPIYAVTANDRYKGAHGYMNGKGWSLTSIVVIVVVLAAVAGWVAIVVLTGSKKKKNKDR